MSNLSSIASLSGKALFWLQESSIFNPTNCESQKIAGDFPSIQAVFTELTQKNQLEQFFDIKHKNSYAFWGHKTIAYVSRTLLSNIAPGIISPIGLIVNGGMTTFYLLRIADIKGKDFIPFLGGSIDRSKDLEENWAKVHYYARGVFADAVLGCNTAIVLLNLYGIGAFAGLVAVASWGQFNNSIYYILKAVAAPEQRPGLYKAFYLRKELGWINASTGQTLKASPLKDNEKIEIKADKKFIGKGHFFNILQTLSRELLSERNKLVNTNQNLKDKWFWLPEQSVDKWKVENFIKNMKEENLPANSNLNFSKLEKISQMALAIGKMTEEALICKYDNRIYSSWPTYYALRLPHVLTTGNGVIASRDPGNPNTLVLDQEAAKQLFSWTVNKVDP